MQERIAEMTPETANTVVTGVKGYPLGTVAAETAALTAIMPTNAANPTGLCLPGEASISRGKAIKEGRNMGADNTQC